MQIHEWNSIKSDYKSLIIGNGASIAVDSIFNYESLYKIAQNEGLISPELILLFNKLKTNNFEKVLDSLYFTKKVNEIIMNPNDCVIQHYNSCRKILVDAIIKAHPKFNKVNKKQIKNISNFIKNFDTVISLNYDLILYWSVMEANTLYSECMISCGKISRIKDGFIKENNHFENNYHYLRKPYNGLDSSTMVFYLHGNLALAQHIDTKLYKETYKIVAPTSEYSSLFDQIIEELQKEDSIPLIVCEGDPELKKDTIRASTYLSTIYEDVFDDLDGNLAIYGWNFQDQDNHILDRLKRRHTIKPFKKIAISVFQNDCEFMTRVQTKLNQYFKEHLNIIFYDSESYCCWNNDQESSS